MMAAASLAAGLRQDPPFWPDVRRERDDAVRGRANAVRVNPVSGGHELRDPALGAEPGGPWVSGCRRARAVAAMVARPHCPAHRHRPRGLSTLREPRARALADERASPHRIAPRAPARGPTTGQLPHSDWRRPRGCRAPAPSNPPTPNTGPRRYRRSASRAVRSPRHSRNLASSKMAWPYGQDG